MTNLNIKSIMTFLICTLCIFSCEEIEMSQFENTNDVILKNEVTSLNLPIVSRSDEECEMCIDVDACCCLVELQIPLQTTALTLQICGVTPGTNENAGCSMDTGDGCYDVGNRAIQVVLDPLGLTKQYFCISPGTAFSIWNQSVGGSGWIRVGC